MNRRLIATLVFLLPAAVRGEILGYVPGKSPEVRALQAWFDDGASVIYYSGDMVSDVPLIPRGHHKVVCEKGSRMRFNTPTDNTNAIEPAPGTAVGIEFHDCWIQQIWTGAGTPTCDHEGPHAIALFGVTDVRLQGCTITGICDGVKAAPVVVASLPAGEAWQQTKNVVIDNCTFDDCGRLGVAITGCINCAVTNSTVNRTHGFSPEGGVDVEPFDARCRITKIRVDRVTCRDLGNGAAGGDCVIVALNSLNQSQTDPLLVRVGDVTAYNIRNGHNILRVTVGVGRPLVAAPPGDVIVDGRLQGTWIHP